VHANGIENTTLLPPAFHTCVSLFTLLAEYFVLDYMTCHFIVQFIELQNFCNVLVER